MRNYMGICKGICSYNLVYNFLIQLLSLQFSFCGALFKRILAWERGISERQFRIKLFLFLDIPEERDPGPYKDTAPYEDRGRYGDPGLYEDPRPYENPGPYEDSGFFDDPGKTQELIN